MKAARCTAVLAGILAALAAGGGPVSAQRYSVTWLGTLGGKGTYPTGINGRGEIVGVSSTSEGATHAFLWKSGKMTDLGTLGGMNSYAVAINDRGLVVGGAQANGEKQTPLSLNPDAFNDKSFELVTWQGGKMKKLDVPSSVHLDPKALNNSGAIVGRMEGFYDADRSGHTQRVNRHAFLLENGKLTDVGLVVPAFWSVATAINDKGQIVGEAFGHEGFLYENGKAHSLPNLSERHESIPYAINNKGQITGWAKTATRQRAVLWLNDSVTDLGTRNTERDNRGVWITSSGVVVVGRCEYSFLWKDGKRTFIGDMQLEGSVPGSISSAQLIAANDNGLIIGTVRDAGETRAFLLTPMEAARFANGAKR